MIQERIARHLRQIFAAAFLSVISVFPAMSATLVGTLGGDVSVDNHGTANYSVPIHTPPGRKGIEPSLSLNYNSQGGNGILGIGFSLSTGFPQAITRGRTILARDGYIDGPDYDTNDKFYLDGKRLIVVSGTYGYDGSKYRTEVDSFANIEAHGSGSNVDYFKVTQKSGVIMTFGKLGSTTDAYQQGGGESQGKAWSYALKRVEDLQGNYLDFNYDDNGQGEHVISSLSYTGNNKTAISPFASVQFLYNQNVVSGNQPGDKGRRDKSSRYVEGRHFVDTFRLDRIVVKFGSTTESAYDLNYQYSANFGPTRLTSIQPSFRNPQSGMDTVNPTQFEWEDAAPSYTDVPNVLITESSNGWDRYFFADVNGDGLSDFVESTSGAVKVKLSTGSNVGSVNNWITTSQGWIGSCPLFKSCDINGDGLADIITGTPNGASGKLYAYLSTGSGFEPLSGGASATTVFTFSDEFRDPGYTTYNFRARETVAVKNRIAIADFTGDGRDDILIHRYDGKLKLIRSNGTSFSTVGTYDLGNRSLQGLPDWELFAIKFKGLHVTQDFSVSMMPCELNGDGITDYAWTESKQAYELQSTGPGSSVNYVYGWKYVYAVTSQPGGGFSSPKQVAQYGWSATGFSEAWRRFNSFYVAPGDVNGDGLTDFVTLNPGNVVTEPPWTQKQKALHRAVYLSKGVSGSPQFALIAETNVADQSNPYVTVGGQTVRPWFDKIQQGEWVNDHYQTVGPFASTNDQIGLLLTLGTSSSSDNVSLADLNYDGRQDYVWYVDSGSSKGWWVMYSLGETFSDPQPAPVNWKPTDRLQPGALSMSLGSRSPLDLNGDGIKDYAYDIAGSSAAPGVEGFHLSNGGTAGVRINKITNGLGRETVIDYAALTQSGVYTKGSGAQYPIREVIDSRRVVYHLDKDIGVDVGGIKQKNKFYYTYAGARTDLSGRGSLGFQAFATLDYNTGLLSYQFTTQSFPMTGLVKREEVYASVKTNSSDPDEPGHSRRYRYLSKTVNEVTCDEVVDDAGARIGTLYPMINTSRIKKWEVPLIDSSHYDFTATSDAPWIVQSSNGSEPSTNLYSDVTAYTWFDNMSTGSLPSTTPPSIFSNDEGMSGDQSGSGSGVKGGFKVNGTTYGAFNLPDKLGTSTFPAKIKYGNVVKIQTDSGDGNKTATTTTFYPLSHFSGVYLPSKAESSVTTSWTDTGDSTYDVTEPANITSYYTSGNSIGLVSSTKIDALNDAQDLLTSYTYTAEGLKETTSVKPGSASAYTVQNVISYDTYKRWPVRVEDAYNHWTETTRENVYGQPTLVSDINRGTSTSRSVETTYDGLGRVLTNTDHLVATSITTTRGFTTSTSSAYSGKQTVSSYPSGLGGVTLASAYYEHSTTTQKPTITTYYDRLARPIRVIKEGYGGQYIATDTVYDKLGRVVATSNPYLISGYSGSATETVYWTKTAYDSVGRVKTITAPNGTVTTNVYHGRVSQVTVDATDRAPQSNTTLVDSRGRTIKVWNDDVTPALAESSNGYKGVGMTGESIRYDLDGAGRMRQTTLLGQAETVQVVYDELGNQTDLDDPDKGHWQYVYDALGQLVQQTNAKGDITYLGYDRLGRKTYTKTDLGGNGGSSTTGIDETARWWYYESATKTGTNATVSTAAKGAWFGSLQRSEIDYNPSSSGTFGSAEHANAYTYDDKGLEALNLHRVDGKHFYVYTGYDSYARPTARNYQWRSAANEGNLSSSSWNHYGVNYAYDAKSYVKTVSDTDGKTWWQENTGSGAKTYDAYDAPVHYHKGYATYGWTRKTFNPADRTLASIQTGSASQVNGTSGSIQNWTYAWDGLGNLKSRGSTLQGGTAGTLVTETFGYDDLNRLETRNGTTIANYEINGNITRKKDVSNYFVSDYDYGEGPAGPHAVTRATFYDSGYKTAYINYDSNGNMAVRRVDSPTGMAIWTAAWTAFDKPVYLAKNGKGSAFFYNANNQRVEQLKFDNYLTGSDRYTDKKLYVGRQMEVDYTNTSSSGATPNWSLDTVRIYIDGPDGRTGAREWKSSNGSKKWQVYFQDHLGSVDAIMDYGATSATFASDSDGKQSKFSYDPWGERRDPTDWSGKPASTSGSNPDATLTPRGFTDHEMLDDIGLVHMNGRIYDPLLGRFLSADKVIDGVTTLQGWNRYSYLKNNPLNKTDPTGYYGAVPAAALQMTGMSAEDSYELANRAVINREDLAGVMDSVSQGFVTTVSTLTTPTAAGMSMGAPMSQQQLQHLETAQAMHSDATEKVSNAVRDGVSAVTGTSSDSTRRQMAETVTDVNTAAAGIATLGAELASSVKSLVKNSPKSGLISKIKNIFKNSDAAKTETVQRVMSKAELKATEETGLIRGGRDGTHHVSDAANSDAGRAQQRLALPQKPEVRATLEVPEGKFSPPSKVEPANNMPGGGMERTATGEIPVKIKKVDEL